MTEDLNKCFLRALVFLFFCCSTFVLLFLHRLLSSFVFRFFFTSALVLTSSSFHFTCLPIIVIVAVVNTDDDGNFDGVLLWSFFPVFFIHNFLKNKFDSVNKVGQYSFVYFYLFIFIGKGKRWEGRRGEKAISFFFILIKFLLEFNQFFWDLISFISSVFFLFITQ